MVDISEANTLSTDSVRRWDKDAKKSYIDKTPTVFIEDGGFAYEAIASDKQRAVYLTSSYEDVEEEVTP
jgi:hypothetical protein